MTGARHTLLKLLLACAGIAIVLFGGMIGWFFFYSRDLPDVHSLARFAPTTAAPVSDKCLPNATVAIPYDAIGANLRSALNAVGVKEAGPTFLAATYEAFIRDDHLHRATLSQQVSQTLFCTPSRELRRHLEEIRTAELLDRRFSQRELFTMYANRAHFGENLTGVQAASRMFFLKDSSDLNIAESALIAALLKSPSQYSPLKHPDRSMLRRNEVIDAMLTSGAISASDADAAKGTALAIAPPRMSAKVP